MILFEACRQRIQRAESRHNAITETWNTFLEEESYYPSVAVEGDGTGQIWVEQLVPFPPTITLDLGEALYQLRAALDGSVYAAAVLETGQDPPPNEQRLEFPICSTPSEFANATRKIKPLSQTRRDIVEKIQPYNAPTLPPHLRPRNFNVALEILNDWARKDRHRKLHVMGSWCSESSPKLRLPPGTTLKRFEVAESGTIDHENHTFSIATFEIEGWRPEMKIQANPDVAIDILVDETPEPCAHDDTLGLRLEAMIRVVELVVDSFEKSFRSVSK